MTSKSKLSRSKLYAVVQSMTDEELRAFVSVLVNPKTYEGIRIVMHAPGHSRPVQVRIVQEALMERNMSTRDTMKLLNYKPE